METGDFNNDNQQQQDTRRNRRVDYRFLVPSRDAGGMKQTRRRNLFFLFYLLYLFSDYW
jgi:hypothetical protein